MADMLHNCRLTGLDSPRRSHSHTPRAARRCRYHKTPRHGPRSSSFCRIAHLRQHQAPDTTTIMCAYYFHGQDAATGHIHEGNKVNDGASVHTNRGHVALAAVGESAVIEALAAGGAGEHDVVAVRVSVARVRRAAASAVVLQTQHDIKYMYDKIHANYCSKTPRSANTH